MAISRDKARMNFKTAISEAKKESKSRNFRESIEIQIKLQDIDLDQPENRFTNRIVLPNPVAKRDKIGVFADDPHLSALREATEEMEDDITVISKRRFDQIKTDPRTIKNLASDVRIFLASVSLMGDIGKHLGKFLAPRNKMPVPLPIGAEVKEFLERTKRTIQVRLRDDPIIYCKIGHEEMDVEDLTENALALLREITDETPKRWGNIATIGFKTTMGPRIEV